MRRKSCTIIVIIAFLMWNVATYLFMATKQPNKDSEERREELAGQFAELQQRLKMQAKEHEIILHQLQEARNELEDIIINKPNSKVKMIEGASKGNMIGSTIVTSFKMLPQPILSIPPIAVLVMACDRITVKRSLDQLLKHRPSAEQFPIVVSQDCGHFQTASVIASYSDKVTHIQHPDLSNIELPKKDQKFKGYYMIARHYKWALNQIFGRLNYSAAIIVEDDLDISPDFFEYFRATYPLLHNDPTLWCVSAWNDNGKVDLVANDPELLYRTDFFPGLGWMLEKPTWLELEPKWPITFWDDWMRHPEQRRNRACIRPEVPRTSTFGKIGVSKGQYFEKHLKFIQHNQRPIPFTEREMSYLLKDKYDKAFMSTVYGSPVLNVNEVVAGMRPEEKVVRVQYDDKPSFKALAKHLGFMDDFKAGVPRSGYLGIVSIMFHNRRIYVAPPVEWKGYDPTWN